MFGKGPDPGGMTCAAIIKGYEKNLELAQSRGESHRQQSMDRVNELEPFYKKCKEEAIGEPLASQDSALQESVSKAYGGPAAAATGVSASSAGFGVNWSAIFVAALVGGALIFIVRQAKTKEAQKGG